MSAVITRIEGPYRARLSLMSRMIIERGDKSDWDQLHDLHYKAESVGFGGKVFRCAIDGKTIGVGMFTVPRMLNAGRNKLFPHLRPGKDTKLVNQGRAFWMNRGGFTWNSRLVLVPIYRGTGVAYRMQNLMMRMTGARFIEFQSSMSKVNPFAAKAGILFAPPRKPPNLEKGNAFFRRWFESLPTDTAGVLAELAAMHPSERDGCVMEMRHTYYAMSAMEKTGNNRANGTSRVDGMEVGYLLRSLQQVAFASPLYGVYPNPDYERTLPEQLPLLAFDNQAVTEPLDLSTL
jgi:ABC-type ATPase with predicted acetyltransferase domain